ncbi:endonuclease/exonuclease/phosphatase family protein [Pontibacter russatus]|uniref:endonuclease/exonuclease/phosphatase family protein n=1 Tax=Pontibacter russatus TaxID=2694929 RepID=UPI001F24950F|nr:endonuclease/exonuclease/phosphatase family protein [Pontibacter russatus]
MTKLFWGIMTGIALLATSCDKSAAPDPAPADQPADKTDTLASLKVMSYNIHHCNPPSKPDYIDINAIVGVVKAQKPDLLALQEVDVNTSRSGALNQAQEIANKLHMRYFFGKAIDYQGGAYGVAILSKYPLAETTVHRLPVKAGTEGEPRVMATAKVTLPDGTTMRFGSTHLDAQSDPANRQLQVRAISDIAAGESLPFIIAGDFNATPDSDVINALDSQFKRTCQVCAPTIPASNPSKAIDFIAYRHPANKFDVAGHQVVSEPYASDHRPVVAVIKIEK